MPNEPERPIEKLLRACARKRRQDAREAPGLELHPATRRMLQGEVARRFRRQEQGPVRETRRWAAAFWPRLVEACVLVTLMAVVASLLIPALRHSPPQRQLAKSEAVRPLASPPAPAAAPPVSAENNLSQSLADREQGRRNELSAAQKETSVLRDQSNRSDVDKQMSLAQDTGAAAAGAKAPGTTLAENRPQPAAPSPSVSEPLVVAGSTMRTTGAGGAPQGTTDSRSLQDSARLSLAKPTTAAAHDRETTVTLDELSGATNALWAYGVTNAFAQSGTSFGVHGGLGGKADQPVVLQNFTQVLPESQLKEKLETKAGLPVLATFQVQQAGGELRVIDSDGSVYTGSLVNDDSSKKLLSSDSLASFKATESAPMAKRAVRAKDQMSLVQSPMRFFRVTGTNRSLNQQVIFSGNLTGLTNQVAAGRVQNYFFATGGGGGPQDPAAAGLLLNSRISGNAVVGTNQVIPIEAVPGP